MEKVQIFISGAAHAHLTYLQKLMVLVIQNIEKLRKFSRGRLISTRYF